MGMTNEKRLERNFNKWFDRMFDAPAVKGPSMFAKGIPDRFAAIPTGGGTIYVEFKDEDSPYGLTKMQEWWGEYLRDSNPNRYFVVETDAELEALKQHVLKLQKIGKKLVEFETMLLRELDDVL